ncbi:MAG: hypothetical protein H0V66_07450 [Bdellovibrionales bacterium]|nr:hypothetical protein [Bdellovibrionales bacterium]
MSNKPLNLMEFYKKECKKSVDRTCRIGLVIFFGSLFIASFANIPHLLKVIIFIAVVLFPFCILWHQGRKVWRMWSAYQEQFYKPTSQRTSRPSDIGAGETNMDITKFNQALELKRQGQFTKSITIYEQLKEEFPSEIELHKALGKVYYLNNQFEKSMASYLMTLHLMGSSHFKNRVFSKDEKVKFVVNSEPLTFHIGCAELAIDLRIWRPQLAKFFDMDRNLSAYCQTLMGNKAQMNEEYFTFCQARGCVQFDTLIQWEKIVFKTPDDIKTMIQHYDNICAQKKLKAA